ncbi:MULTISPECIES: maleylpyruvate isomerase family mycothiol-dependent enzyme [Mycolicibacterium]|uniref:maleylpyruvate isomerase family mycothiol-dependent enzyme n=1 Tax=Mycolicibacterium TaxID=1866885 RepID=UPI00298C5151|nr:maleylpyruvate isomerase family mycothiol-dependent enzyme [Mycolicibacterium sp. D5.8-2]MDW5610032.1 maleylpyruvate isomerase family mycothiol-dependent enzyme [Mycolicibacterium sp. D5.8-2]
MRFDKAAVWRFVHAERARLADDLAGLPHDAWATPSLCPGWDVHDVLAHLVDSAKSTRVGFARRMMAARFDFDADNALGIARERSDDPRDTLDALRAVVPLTRTPIAPRRTRLVEAIVHGEDIRRPLGIKACYDAHAAAAALVYQVGTAVAMGGGRERAEGLRLIATDSDYEAGRGDAVRGSTVDLLLAVSGRPVPGYWLRE